MPDIKRIVIHDAETGVDANVDSAGNLLIYSSMPTLKSVSGVVSSSGDNTIISAVSGKKLTVYSLILSTTTTTETLCKFTDGAGGTELFRVDLQASSGTISGVSKTLSPPAYIFQGSAGNALVLNLGAAQSIHYSISYWEE